MKDFHALGTVILDGERKRIQLNSPAYYQTALNRLPIGGKVTISVTTKQATRSQSQLRYYHVIINLLSDHTGYLHSEMHDFVTSAKFGTKMISLNGKTIEVRRSIANSAKMSTSDMVELIHYAQELCADLGIVIPTPEELGYCTNTKSLVH